MNDSREEPEKIVLAFSTQSPNDANREYIPKIVAFSSWVRSLELHNRRGQTGREFHLKFREIYYSKYQHRPDFPRVTTPISF
jgi:hypothetical protein